MTAIKRNRLVVALVIALGVCVFVIGDLAVQRAQALPDDTYKELQNFANVMAIVPPIGGTPATAAGIKSGDQIVKIENDFTKGMTLTDAVKRMRGPKGSKIHLTLHREGIPDLFTVTLTRDLIRIDSEKAKNLTNGLDYVRISTFQD